MSQRRPKWGSWARSTSSRPTTAWPRAASFSPKTKIFLRLDAARIPHAGIAYCVKETKSIGEINQGLVLIWEVYEPEEMTGWVEYL
jgi:hypothetical protein